MIKKIYRRFFKYKTTEINSQDVIDTYKQNGCEPWSEGYHEYKWKTISEALKSDEIRKIFKASNNLENFGKGIDERIVEYPWILSHISSEPTKLLDAGSTFNYKEIVDLDIVKNKDLSIVTYYPEYNCFYKNRISYLFNDLRDLPYKNNYFDEIVCQSTLEHIDMDNSIYGYSKNDNSVVTVKSYEYLKVVKELERILKSNGLLLITVPYGKFENHGFFQQFDKEMIGKINEFLILNGSVEFTYFKYQVDGWKISNRVECDNAISYNPHTGIGKGTDNAAHSRAICCVKFKKK